METKLLLLAVCVPAIGLAQLRVKGVVNIESGSPLPYASVLLLNSSDSTLVKGQIAQADGSFLIDVNQKGSYFLTVSALGFEEVSTKVFMLSDANVPFDPGRLVAVEKAEELDEVIVDAERPMFEQKIDRTIINVQSNISRAGGSALDVLQRSPGVTVDQMNGAIALSGKQGARVMINGKVSRIPMAAVVQMLDGMNAENIERIELITTPPSKYEAEGDAGMINIVMKKTADLGTNGSLSAFSGYGRGMKYGGTLNLNHRTRRLNIYGDLSTRHNHGGDFIDTDWSILNNNERTRTISMNDRKNYLKINSGTTGFDWNIGERTSIGGLFSFFDRRWDMDAFANITKTTDPIRSESTMRALEQNDWLQLLGNLSLTHAFSNGYTVSVDFDMIDYNSQNPTDYDQHSLEGQGTHTIWRSRKDTGIDIWTGTIDLMGKVSDNVTLEIGAKRSSTPLTNNILVDQLENGDWTVYQDLTTYAEMFEGITAGYVSAKINASDKTDVQMGLRYEHTVTNIDTQTEQNVVDRNYGGWFPTFFLQRKIDGNNSWVISYNRRISRPSFFQLAPFVIFNDPNNFFSGNIALLPSFTDAFKLEFVRKSVLLSLQYSHDKNAITLFQPRISEDNKQVSAAQNLDYRNNVSVVLSFPVQFTKWWEMQVNATGSNYWIKAVYLDNPVSLSIMNLGLNGSHKFKIAPSVTAEVSGFYQSRQLFGVLDAKPFGSVDIGIEKKFKNSNLRFSYTDIFATNKWQWTSDLPEENLDTSIYLDFATTVVTVTWLANFGNQKLKSKKSKRTASKEEQERLR